MCKVSSLIQMSSRQQHCAASKWREARRQNVQIGGGWLLLIRYGKQIVIAIAIVVVVVVFAVVSAVIVSYLRGNNPSNRMIYLFISRAYLPLFTPRISKTLLNKDFLYCIWLWLICEVCVIDVIYIHLLVMHACCTHLITFCLM